MSEDIKNTDKDKIKSEDQVKDKKEATELSDDELNKVVGGTIGAPIFKKKP
jgi:bacteriocin-like protein